MKKVMLARAVTALVATFCAVRAKLGHNELTLADLCFRENFFIW